MCMQGVGAAAGQLDSPWDHLPPLFGLPVSTIMFTDQLLFLTAPSACLDGEMDRPLPEEQRLLEHLNISSLRALC